MLLVVLRTLPNSVGIIWSSIISVTPRPVPGPINKVFLFEGPLSLIDKKKKLLVIFRGINIDYFDQSTTIEVEEKNLLKNWEETTNQNSIMI